MADLAMDFATIHVGRVRRPDDEGRHAREVRPGAGRHRPVPLVDYQNDAVIRYKANPDYWGGKAKIDDLVFAITPDASVR